MLDIPTGNLKTHLADAILRYPPLQGSLLVTNSSSGTQPPPTLTITVLFSSLTNTIFCFSPNCRKKYQTVQFQRLILEAMHTSNPWSNAHTTRKLHQYSSEFCLFSTQFCALYPFTAFNNCLVSSFVNLSS